METDEAFVEVVPRLGGSITAFDVKREGERLPIFRRWTGRIGKPARRSARARWCRGSTASPAAASIFGGKFYPIAPNDPHGAGAAAWRRLALALGGGRAQAATRIELRLRSRAIPPFDYEATQVLSLDGRDARHGAVGEASRVRAVPLWPRPAPLVRAHAGRPAAGEGDRHVARAAAGVSGEDRAGCDSRRNGISITPQAAARRFHRQRLCRLGRPRAHRMDRPRDRRSTSRPIPSTRFYHVYSLDKDCPIFCFEPVTHPNNALASRERRRRTACACWRPGRKRRCDALKATVSWHGSRRASSTPRERACALAPASTKCATAWTVRRANLL